MIHGHIRWLRDTINWWQSRNWVRIVRRSTHTPLALFLSPRAAEGRPELDSSLTETALPANRRTALATNAGRICALLVILYGAGLMSSPEVGAQDAGGNQAPAGATTTIGPRNPPLQAGAEAFMAGQDEAGVRLTLEGLSLAQGRREEEAALSNLCSGYLRLRQFDSALQYCNRLIELNDNAWRAYNSRAMVYLELKEYEKADQDLTRAEAINPGARTLKIARELYMDTVHPVAPAVEIDDR